MKIFTIESGRVSKGAVVDTFTLSNGEISIPAILVGEQGRGRQLGVLPVQLSSEQYAEWKKEGKVRTSFATVGETKAGNPKLFACEKDSCPEECICVFRTKIGFRGGNSHTGDRVEYPRYYVPGYEMDRFREKFSELNIPIKEEYSNEETDKYLSILKECGVTIDIFFRKDPSFLEFPGNILSAGRIAQGDAGRMGSGDQYIAVIPENQVFRTGYSGRLYGDPSTHYYVFQNGEILSATWEERKVADLF